MRNAISKVVAENRPERLPLIISAAALVVSLGSAWFSQFRPASVVGDLSYLMLWRLSSNNDGVVTDTVVAPVFWLRNIGARPTIISDVRLVFVPQDGQRYASYPVSLVPREAVESASEFKDVGRLSTGSPFRSFSLVASEQWISSYRFSVVAEVLKRLVGRVTVAIEFSSGVGTAWSPAMEDEVDFGSAPFHLQPIPVGGAQSIPVYSERSKLRRGQ